MQDTCFYSSLQFNYIYPYTHMHIDAVPRCCGYYGQGSGIVRVLSVSCSGYEEDINDCYYSTSSTYNHQYDVGVQCLQGY